jgi:hypothetical protein
MNPNHQEQADLRLPTPVSPQELGGAVHEQAPAVGSPESSASAQQMPTLMPAMPTPPPNATPPAATTRPSPTTNIPLPQAADDSDLIEKEWVEKAKVIVASTHDDPFIQSREVSRVKSDYIKKRYNKEVKQTEV